MNFFGHVVVTSWYSTDPAIALGSMLPDLANMCRGRVRETLDQSLTRGVALHHETDAAFHVLEEFSQLERESLRTLQDMGVGRGPAMGTAHVAVELLLDGALLHHDDACALYLAALQCDQATAPQASMTWRDPAEMNRWLALRARLADYGLPHGYRDPDVVTDRIGMILARYKTLALDDHELELVRAHMPELQERVTRAAPHIMRALRTAMA